MSLATASDVIFVVALVGYLLAGYLLLSRGWLFRAGTAMLLFSLLPLTWQGWFTDSEALGFGFLLMMMAPIPLLLIGAGLVGVIVRAFGALLRRFDEKAMHD